MQSLVPELLEFKQETTGALKSYGPDVNRHGSYAYKASSETSEFLSQTRSRCQYLQPSLPVSGQTHQDVAVTR